MINKFLNNNNNCKNKKKNKTLKKESKVWISYLMKFNNNFLKITQKNIL